MASPVKQKSGGETDKVAGFIANLNTKTYPPMSLLKANRQSWTLWRNDFIHSAQRR